MSITFDPSLAQPYTDAVTVHSGTFGVGPVTFGVTGTGTLPYSPPATGSSAAITFVPATVNLIAGLNGPGYGGDGGPANSINTKLNSPAGIVYDSSGNLFIADSGNHVVRRIDHATGYISTFAGQQANPGNSNGGGVATSARFEEPWGLAIDSSDNLYMSDLISDTVWKITPGGAISIFAGGGTGSCGGAQTDTLGDGCPATDAKLSDPEGLAIDANNNLYIADVLDYVIRKVSSATGKISIFAGSSTCGGGLYSTGAGPYLQHRRTYAILVGLLSTAGELLHIGYWKQHHPHCEFQWLYFDLRGRWQRFVHDGWRTCHRCAALSVPEGVYVDPANRVYISDYFDGVIRQVNSPGNIFTVMGNYSELTASSIGEPDTATGTADNEAFTMDVYGNIVATERGAPAVTSAGTTGQYIFANQQVDTTSSPAYVTVLNPSGVALNFTGAPSVNGPFTIVTGAGAGTCNLPGSLASGASCTIGITFSPTLDQAYTGSIGLDSNANSSPSTINLSGTGTGTPPPPPAAIASLSTDSLAFTPQVVNTTSLPQQVTLTNTGSATLSYSLAMGGAGFAPASGTNDCPISGTLTASAFCYIYVTFTPTSATSFTGSIQVTDTVNTPNDSPSVTLSGNGIVFSSNVGTTQPAQAVTVNVMTAGTVSSINVLTQGTAGLDYAFASGGTCSTETAYTVGQTCTVYVAFTPAYPGSRPGAVVLTDGVKNVLGTTYLPGTGYGPEVTFGGGTVSQLPSFNNNGYQAPLGVIVDANNNVYAADTLNSRIVKIPWTGSGFGTPINIVQAQPLNQPSTVAVDGAGNIFITDTEDFQIVEVPWNGTGYGTRIVLDASGLPDATGIAVDGNGNLFFSDGLNEHVSEMAWTAAGYAAPVVLSQASGLHAPHGLAVDANLNLYIADSDDGQVVELPWTASGFGAETVLANGFFYPQAVAVDAAGDVYIANTDAQTVVELPFNGGSYGSQVTLPFSIGGTANGLALDSSGDVYVASGSGDDVVELTVSAPPSLMFNTPTNVGSTDTTDGPKTASISNIGNASLYITFLQSGTNPSYPDTADFPVNPNDSKLCVEDNSVNPGSSCDISVNFTPTTGGPITETIVISDYNLNNQNASQSIQVSGNGIGSANPAASLSLSTLDFGGVQIDTTSPALIETVTNTGGGTLSISGVTIAQTGTNAFFQGTGANQCTNSTMLTANQSCNVYVTFDPSVTGQTYNGTLNIADNAAPSPQSASLTGVGDYFNQTVGSTTPAQPVSVFITTAGTLSAINVVTSGAQTADFTKQTQTGSPWCTAGTVYSAGQLCTVDIVFTPQYSGARNGSIYLTDASGNVLGTTFLQGTGNAPQIVFGPVTPQTAIGYATGLAGVAVDAADDLFYVNASNQVIEAPVSGPGETVANLNGLLGGVAPNNITIDPSGNLFVASDSATPLIEVPSTGLGTWGAPVSIDTGSVANVAQVAVDGLGNLYIVAPNRGSPVAAHRQRVRNACDLLPFPGSGAFKPGGVAVDPSFDVYAIGQNTGTKQDGTY